MKRPIKTVNGRRKKAIALGTWRTRRRTRRFPGTTRGATLPPTIEAGPTLTPGAYEPPPYSANFLGNPGLEEGTNYWFALGWAVGGAANRCWHSSLQT